MLLSALLLLRKNKIFVGWVERSETQQNQRLLVLGFVPQPNLRLNTKMLLSGKVEFEY
ncbi:hypothetical protein [Nostoc sp. NMS1]|uniref:hypothetical protein n=1 Tax=Nostoc sp. NMS1 TaxID=2815388 RepID=UPI0025FF9D36|nr:hypothetical protein [Nostoc sp. NMS1]